MIHECGATPHRKFVSLLARKIHRPKSIFEKREKIEKSVDGLIRTHLIEEKESLILCDDIYREGRGDVDENIKNLVKILFKASEDRKLKIFTYLSLMGFANVLSDREKFDEEQIEVTRKIIELNPDYAAAHYNLGNLLKDQGRCDDAEKEWRVAIRADPDYAAAHSNLGALLKDQGRYDDAEKEYREAIRADPDIAAAHSNLGNLLDNLKRYDEAEKEYRDAIRANPDYAAAHSNLGNLLKDQGRYDEAEKEYRDAIQADLDFAEAHGNLGLLFLEKERPEEAKKEFGIAKELFRSQGRGDDVKKVEELLSPT